MGGEPAHARLAPSSAYRWLKCNGSAVSDYPEDTNPAAEAGTVAHEAVSDYLEDEGVRIPSILESVIYDGCEPLVGDLKATEIADSAVQYVDHIESVPGEKQFEQKIYHSELSDFFGTIDTLVVQDGELSIIDLKTGTYKVNVRQNSQLLCYATLARQVMPEVPYVKATIVQPRVFKKPQTIKFWKEQLNAFEDSVRVAAQSSELKFGSHCKFCALKPNCPEYQKNANQV